MGIVRKFTAIMVLICLLFCLCACTGDDKRIYVAVSEMPQTLDAQTAESDSELLITRNIYEGLMRQNERGEIVPGAAANYEFSSLTYTFTLRDKLFWADGEPVVAKDFIFGIKRALMPETKAPFARLLYSVEGAPEAHSGTISTDNIGISAPDDKTVKIKLSYDDKDFLKTLSMPVSMPCREDFFIDSTGKYGLEKDCVLSNGSYRLARWNKEGNGIRLYKNEKYNGDFKPHNGGVFIAKDKEKTVSEKLISGEADIAFLSSENLADVAKRENIKTVAVQNICWVLSLGGELTPNIRQALCMCCSPDVYKSEIQSGFSASSSFFPDVLGITVLGSPWGFTYNSVTPQTLISEEVKNTKNKKFPSTTLVYAQSEPLRPAITKIVSGWQEDLSAFINIKATDKPLDTELKEHSLSLCAFPVKADSTVAEYINKFGVDYSGDIASANTQMYGTYNLLPIAFENTTVGYLENISEVYMNATGGYIDFSYVVKK